MPLVFNPFTGNFDFTGTSGGGGGSISGTIADTQVAFGTAADTIGGSNALTFEDTNGTLTIDSVAEPQLKLGIQADAGAKYVTVGASGGDLTITAGTGSSYLFLGSGNFGLETDFLTSDNGIEINDGGLTMDLGQAIFQGDTSNTPNPLVQVTKNVTSAIGLIAGLQSVMNGVGQVSAVTNNGVIAAKFQARDGATVGGTTDGNLFGAWVEVAPTVDRGSNAPWDDADGIIIINTGTKKATDAIFIDGDSPNGWATHIATEGNADFGIHIAATYATYGIDFTGATITSNATLALQNGGLIVGDKTSAHTWKLAAYDNNDAVYRTFVTFTNGNTPTCDISAPSGGTLSGNYTTLQVGGANVLTTSTGATVALDNLASVAINTSLLLGSSDGGALGSTSKQWSDLFLAEGGVINWDNGDATLTQVGDVVTLGGADLKVTTPGNAATSVLTTDGTQTLTNKRITKRVTTASDATSITPNSDSADITYQANTQAAGTLTINADGGTPTNGQSWLLKIKSTNAQTFAWNAVYIGGTIALPTVTSGGSKIDNYAFLYDTVKGAWEFTGAATGFASS